MVFAMVTRCGYFITLEFDSLSALRANSDVACRTGNQQAGDKSCRQIIMNILNLPPPSWMTEDLVLLEEQARRFIAAEYVPQIESWNAQGMYDRAVWTKAGAAGLLCPAI